MTQLVRGPPRQFGPGSWTLESRPQPHRAGFAQRVGGSIQEIEPSARSPRPARPRGVLSPVTSRPSGHRRARCGCGTCPWRCESGACSRPGGRRPRHRIHRRGIRMRPAGADAAAAAARSHPRTPRCAMATGGSAGCPGWRCPAGRPGRGHWPRSTRARSGQDNDHGDPGDQQQGHAVVVASGLSRSFVFRLFRRSAATRPDRLIAPEATSSSTAAMAEPLNGIGRCASPADIDQGQSASSAAGLSAVQAHRVGVTPASPSCSAMRRHVQRLYQPRPAVAG